MRFARAFVLALLFLLVGFPIFSQQTASTVQRDLQAITVLQAALKAMGGTVPTDSTATGSITVVAGSQTSTGTIRILTRGTNQTFEQISLPQYVLSVTYSGGLADQTLNNATSTLSLERTATSQSVSFPLPFLAAVLANSDFSIQQIGSETLNGKPVQHVRLQNSFNSQPQFQHFADFAVFDVWLDTVTTLPERISFVRREASGAAPRVTVDTYFAAYHTVSGVAYPSQISISLNGTPWAAVTFSSVALNTGLTDASFQVQ